MLDVPVAAELEPTVTAAKVILIDGHQLVTGSVPATQPLELEPSGEVYLSDETIEQEIAMRRQLKRAETYGVRTARLASVFVAGELALAGAVDATLDKVTDPKWFFLAALGSVVIGQGAFTLRDRWPSVRRRIDEHNYVIARLKGVHRKRAERSELEAA